MDVWVGRWGRLEGRGRDRVGMFASCTCTCIRTCTELLIFACDSSLNVIRYSATRCKMRMRLQSVIQAYGVVWSRTRRKKSKFKERRSEHIWANVRIFVSELDSKHKSPRIALQDFQYLGRHICKRENKVETGTGSNCNSVHVRRARKAKGPVARWF